MDANRFDILAKRMGTSTSRRAAVGAAAAGGILGAFGLRGCLKRGHRASRASIRELMARWTQASSVAGNAS